MTAPRPTILLVEDDENDIFFMERAMSKTKLGIPLHGVINGEQALQYLEGTGEYSDRALHPVPDLVFLDLKLPFVPGFEVLEWIRRQPALSSLPVVVLTSSPEECDRKMAAELGALAYCVKPPTEQMLLQLLQSVPSFAKLIPIG